MYSRGPIIKILEGAAILSGICGVLAIAGFIFAILSYEGRIDTIQQARQRSAVDSCRIDTAVILRSAATGPHKYPVRGLNGGRLIGFIDTGSVQKREAAAHAFLAEVGLGDCKRYGVLVRTGKLPLLSPSPPRALPPVPHDPPLPPTARR